MAQDYRELPDKTEDRVGGIRVYTEKIVGKHVLAIVAVHRDLEW